jgi:hypothetical protein
MGKASIILALGISTIIALLIIDLNANNNQSVQTTVDMFEQTQARLIANSGVEINLEQLRRNKTLKGTFLNNKVHGGTYDSYIYGPDTLLKIKTVANFNGRSHTSLVTAKRSKVTIPNVNSSLYVSSENLSLNLNGNVEIIGHDTNLDGSAGPNPSLHSVTLDTPEDSADFRNKIKPKISGQLDGLGGTPSIGTTDETRDWVQLAQDFIFAADITLSSGSYATGTILGTWDEPKITVANGNVNFSGTAEGYGILVVNGNLTMSGQFTFRGLIIAYGESTLEIKTVGNGGIYGGTVFVGESVDIQATGNANFFYSSQAIKNAQDKLKSSRFDIVSWWE